MLEPRWRKVRDNIAKTGDKQYRVLGDDDILIRGDETVCASLLLEDGDESWHPCTVKEWGRFFGKTIAQMNDFDHNGEMDCGERLFRRPLSKRAIATKSKAKTAKSMRTIDDAARRRIRQITEEILTSRVLKGEVDPADDAQLRQAAREAAELARDVYFAALEFIS